MKKEEKTIKKIQELVPEITQPKSPDFGNYIGLCEKVYGRNENGEINFPKYLCQAEDIYKKMKKGRPITLEDCIIAFDKMDYGRYFGKELVNIWQLNKPFHEQTSKTKDCIGDLLLDEKKEVKNGTGNSPVGVE